jgi:hypothetical protein
MARESLQRHMVVESVFSHAHRREQGFREKRTGSPEKRAVTQQAMGNVTVPLIMVEV